MITVNKPANFYWEYTCFYNQTASGVNIISFNNNTLATVTASRTNPGYAVFTFSSPILTYKKVYLSGNSLEGLVTPPLPTFFQYMNLTEDTVTIRQFNSAGSFIDRFTGYLTVRIYP